MAGIFFGIVTRQAIRRGSFTSVKDLITAIGTLINGWNDRCQPVTWTKTPDQLIPRCRPGKEPSRRERAPASRHDAADALPKRSVSGAPPYRCGIAPAGPAAGSTSGAAPGPVRPPRR